MDLASISDVSLAELCLGAPVPRPALAELVRRFGPQLLQTIAWTFRRYCRGRENEAADVFQQVFVSLFEENGRRLANYDPSKGGLGTYLSAAARNMALTALGKARNGHVELTDEIADESAGADAATEQAELMARIACLVADCADSERLIYHLYFEELMPPETVAGVMGISVDSVYAKKAKLIKKLRARLSAVVREERG
jgi:RNA polymerase sigma factor (sigma-70 family)